MELIPASLAIESHHCKQQGRPDYQNRARNAVRLHARRIARVSTSKAQVEKLSPAGETCASRYLRACPKLLYNPTTSIRESYRLADALIRVGL